MPFEMTLSEIGWDFDRFQPEQLQIFQAPFGQIDPNFFSATRRPIRRSKNLYVMNNNGARNLALDIGRARAKWAMPWDGNCFSTAAAFRQIREAVEQQTGIFPSSSFRWPASSTMTS